MTNADDSRSRAEQLIAIADKLIQQPVAPPPKRGRALPILLGVLGVIALGAGALGLVSSDDSGSSTPPATDSAPTEITTASSASVAPTDAPTSPTPTTSPPSTAAPTSAAPTTTNAPTTTTEPADPSNPVRWAEFTGGKVYLQGVVPDQATADEVRDKAAAVVGADNVVVQYEIVAGAPRPDSAPLYVRDSVLFPPNSISINDTARGVLDLGVALMGQNPQITIDIHGYTDSVGPEESNIALAQARIDNIFLYLVSKGIDPARLTRIAHGEADPVADNGTEEGRAKNRRVEFTINNLLG
jgi:outer membrane protein OmpA-like peptidoglycan-associated protein